MNIKHEKKTAIVTGASSGIGQAISQMLLSLGYVVYGFGRNFSDTTLSEASSNFHPIVCDLMKTQDLTLRIKEIRKEHLIDLLVNNAGVGYFGPHEELSGPKIHQMVTTNLEVPMLLSQLLLRDFKKTKGCIVNISSITAKESNTHGCAYGATKAALTSFSRSLFDEVRKYGVKVICIHPDMTQSNFYRNADFTQDTDIESYLLPEEVAEAVKAAISCRDGLVISDITLQPQLHRIKRK